MAGPLCDSRNKNYMKTISPARAFQKRETFAVKLRKDKWKQEFLCRRCMKTDDSRADHPLEILRICPDLINESIPFQTRLSYLHSILIESPYTETGYLALLTARQLISRLSTRYTKDYVRVGFVPILITLAGYDDERYKAEASWCLCNIASGDHDCTVALLQHNILETCFSLLTSPSEVTISHSLWCLSNLAGDDNYTKELLCEKGVLELLISLGGDYIENHTILGLCVQGLSHLLDRQQPLEILTAELCMKFLKETLKTRLNVIIVESLKCLNKLVRRGSVYIQILVNEHLLKTIVSYLHKRQKKLLLHTMTVIGNISAGDNSQCQCLLNHNILDRLYPLLTHEDQMLQKDAYWTLSNLAACDMSQIAELVQHPILSLALGGLTETYYVRKESSFIFANISILGSYPSILALFNLGVVPALQGALNNNTDGTIIMNLLKTCQSLLNAGQSELQENYMQRAFVDSDLYNAIEAHIYGGNLHTAAFANKIIANHFDPQEFMRTDPPQVFSLE